MHDETVLFNGKTIDDMNSNELIEFITFLLKQQKQSKKKKCFIFHDWGNWKDLERGGIYNAHNDERCIGSFIRQEKRCLNCNIAKIRYIRNRIT